jgi:hypothetical protein
MDDDTLIQTLLYRNESETLDFKVKQYPQNKNDPEGKAKFLKDMLAFANTWRTETAYILIGIKNDTKELVELDVDPDDSRIQQFITEKTNIPLNFSYRSLVFQGVKLGLYTIPVQNRPIFVTAKFSSVDPNVVYVRRGSGTFIANPEEIARMGAARAADTQAYAPNLVISMVSKNDDPTIPFSLAYTNYQIDDIDGWPDFRSPQDNMERFGIISPRMEHDNINYYREKALFYQQKEGLIPIRLQISNTGNNFADDVRIYVYVPVIGNLDIIADDEILKPPTKLVKFTAPIDIRSMFNTSRKAVSIERELERTIAVFRIGKIQTGETISTEEFYLVRPPKQLKALQIQILSDQLRSPLHVEIPLVIEAKLEWLSFEDVRLMR